MAGEDSSTASTSQRRLAAILAADVASRPVAEDDPAALSALDAARSTARRCIEAAEGRVVDRVGDSVLALFESAGAAVSAALAIQRELAQGGAGGTDPQRMRLRIGVHLGEVIERSDGSVVGDGVNIAAHLGGLAGPGAVAVSDAVRSAVRGKLIARFDDLGSHEVQHIAEPLHAWRASESLHARPARAQGQARLHAAGPLLRRRIGAGRRRGDSRYLLPLLLIELAFIMLPLLVLGANWPDGPAARPASFSASP